MRLFPIYTWTKGIRNFDHRRRRFSNQPWAQGVILLACVVVAMLLANLPFTKEFYHNILETKVSLFFKIPGGKDVWFPKGMTIESFINDILMTVFFFTVGLEIRREMKNGELSSVKKALMPVIAAFGGVVAPAVIFAIVNHGTAASSGWGIPTATDIAFAVGLPSILKVNCPSYLASSVPLSNFLTGGSTMSGVVMAFLVPMTARYNEAYYRRKRIQYIKRLNEYKGIVSASAEFPNGPQRHCLRRMAVISRGSIPMSYRLEHALGPWVNFLIMPLFALANAGVEIPDVSYFNVFHIDPALGGVSMGIFLGLLIGKPLGISLASFIAVKLKAGEMPAKASWKMLIAVACLGGIGFTMSIFVDTLSFGDQTPEIMSKLRDMGKVAVLMGSLCAGILGSLLISIIHKLEKKA